MSFFIHTFSLSYNLWLALEWYIPMLWLALMLWLARNFNPRKEVVAQGNNVQKLNLPSAKYKTLENYCIYSILSRPCCT